MPVITIIPLWTVTLVEGEACCWFFPFLWDFSCRVSLPPKNSVGESWTVFPFPLGSRSSSGSCFIPHYISSRELTFCCPLSLFPCRVALGHSARGQLSSCLSRDEKCFSRIFCSTYRINIFLSLRSIPLSERCLDCTETLTVPAVVTV